MCWVCQNFHWFSNYWFTLLFLICCCWCRWLWSGEGNGFHVPFKTVNCWNPVYHFFFPLFQNYFSLFFFCFYDKGLLLSWVVEGGTVWSFSHKLHWNYYFIFIFSHFIFYLYLNIKLWKTDGLVQSWSCSAFVGNRRAAFLKHFHSSFSSPPSDETSLHSVLKEFEGFNFANA
jgi:hypothetical protein